MTPIVPITCFQGRLRDVVRTSWGRLESISQGHPLDVRLELPLDVISRRPQDVRSRRPHYVIRGHHRDGQIESLADELGTSEGNVCGTS